MNLQSHITPELWSAIASTYDAKNYSGAILDAMHELSTMLRERAGVDGDGASLAGQALGGDTPRLRINRLETQTERDAQRGLEQLVRGMYQAIRNPRSHEHIDDTQDVADAVIVFVNYVLGILGQSREPFTLEDFLHRVFDRDFVQSDRYADLLAEEIPASKRVDTLIEIYRRKSDGDGENLKYVVRAILNVLPKDQIPQLLDVVSEDLKFVQYEKAIRCCLQILPPQLWPQIKEVARLRIENRLIQSIREGKTTSDPLDGNKAVSGALGTWASDYLKHFTMKERVGQALARKIAYGDVDEQRYVTTYFMSVLSDVMMSDESMRRFCTKAIGEAVRKNNALVRDSLVSNIRGFSIEWQNEIAESLKDLTDGEHPMVFLSDGTPFLTSEDEGAGEIPF